MANLFIYTTPHPAHSALAESLKCERIQSTQGIPFFGRILNAMNIYLQIRQNKYDIILTESISRDLVAGAEYKCNNPKTKLVALLTDPKLYELKTAPLFDKMLTMWALSKADVLLVGSNMMMELVPHEFRAKTRLFYPGVENLPEYLKKSAKFSQDFVFVGRLDDYKGTDLLPELWNDIRTILPGAKLFVAGDGPNKYLFKNHTQDNVFYIGKTKNALFMHQCASFYISLARFEPSGVAILEAMAQGLIPIVTRGVGYSTIVKEIHPKLVISSNPEALKIIETLVKNKTEWACLSKKCKRVAAKYSYKYMTDEFKKVLFCSTFSKSANK